MGKRLVVTIARIYVSMDTFLYKNFNIVTPWRKRNWKRNAKKLQRLIDAESARVNYLNSIYGTCYTAKQALQLKEK